MTQHSNKSNTSQLPFRNTPAANPAPPPLAQSLLRRLDKMDSHYAGGQDSGHEMNSAINPTRWMLPYADLLTLLFGLFIALFGIMKSDNALWHSKADHLKSTMKQHQLDKTSHKTIHQKPGLKTTSLVNAQPVQQTSSEQQLAKELTTQLAKDKALAKGLKIHSESSGVVISITDHILFAPGQAVLSAEAKQKLDIIAKTLSKINRPIRIEGHTDNSPIQTSMYPSNWELSTARATQMIQYLIQSHHFLPARLSAAGYGEFHPVANNSSEEGKQKNRRVDIVLLAP